jgi:hypothetical protein
MWLLACREKSYVTLSVKRLRKPQTVRKNTGLKNNFHKLPLGSCGLIWPVFSCSSQLSRKVFDRVGARVPIMACCTGAGAFVGAGPWTWRGAIRRACLLLIDPI